MNQKVYQEFDEAKVELDATKKAISRLAEKQGRLEGQLTRLNLVHQIQTHGVARHTPVWIVNSRNKVEVNSSTR